MNETEYRLALSVLNALEAVQNTPHIISGIICAKEAVRKQIPIKPDLEGDGYDEKGELIYDTGYCPNCRHEFEVDYDSPKHCPDCGQALDWSDTEC